METIKITIHEQRKIVSVHSPFHPAFIAAVKNLNGKWNAATLSWEVDIRDLQRIKDLCIDIYGTDGETPVELVSVYIDTAKVPQLFADKQLFLCGSEVCSRSGRDYPVRLGNGVIVVQGGFYRSGGSAKYPSCDPLPGTVLEVRDVPKPLAEKAQLRYAEGITIER